VDGLLSCGRLAAESSSLSGVRRWREGDGCDGDDLDVSLGGRRACLKRRTPSMMDCRRDDLTAVEDAADVPTSGMSTSTQCSEKSDTYVFNILLTVFGHIL